jgi:hypothetical protein
VDNDQTSGSLPIVWVDCTEVTEPIFGTVKDAGAGTQDALQETVLGFQRTVEVIFSGGSSIGNVASSPFISGDPTNRPPGNHTDDPAQMALFHDIDATLARLETGISHENAILDDLLGRLTKQPA